MLTKAFLLPLLLAVPLVAQISQLPPARQVPAQEALVRAQRDNVLTSDGKPFHAVLKVKPEKEADPAFEASVTIFWQDPQNYQIQVESPQFGQKLTVGNGVVSEVNRGDFYPNWLHNFVLALVDPMPRQTDLAGLNQSVAVGPNVYSCLRRDDRPGGITDQKTWAQICFLGEDIRLNFVIDFTYNMESADFSGFKGKHIARTYTTGTKGHQRLIGKLTTLESWSPDQTLFTNLVATPPSARLLTTFVSTAQEESMLERAPTDVKWPTVREGKLDGYMIVEAVTDKTGQVRETSKHNSDNAGLEEYGREVALRYKFKPLIVDGVAQQMIMPLVLHFTTTLGDPIPELDDKTSRKLITGCSLPREIDDAKSAGKQIVIQFQIQDDGHLMTLGTLDRSLPVLGLFRQFQGCHYEIYKQNGVPTPYHANVTMQAK